MRRLGFIALATSGCVAGTGIGGAVSSSSTPDAGGFHMRLSAGGGWGTRYGTAIALLEGQHVAGEFVFGGGGELAVFLRRFRRANISLLARSTYSIDGSEDVDLRVFEVSPGIGLAMLDREHGPGTFGLYVINHRVVDGEDRVGWAHGVAVMFVAPISAAIARRR